MQKKVAAIVFFVLFLFSIVNFKTGEAKAASADEVLAEAFPYAGQLYLNSKHYNSDGFILREFGGTELIRDSEGGLLSKDVVLTWKTGEATVNYADLLAAQKQSTTELVYGCLLLNMPSNVVPADGNYRFIVKTGDNPAVFYTDLSGGVFSVPLTPDSSKAYNPLTNPLQKSIIAWRTSTGWQKIEIMPVSEADAVLTRAMPNSALDKLELNVVHYNPTTGILYLDVKEGTGELKTPDGVALSKEELLSFSTGTLIVRYADTLAGQVGMDKDGNTCYGYLRLDMPSDISKIILKTGDNDAFFDDASEGIFYIPLTEYPDKPYNWQTNPLKEAVIAWQNSSGAWTKLAVIPLSQAEQILSSAASSSVPLTLSSVLYGSDGKLYADVLNKSGTLTAKDAQTILTKDNVPSWAGGVLTLNYAETLAGQNTGQGYGKVGLTLPEDVMADDGRPRFILKQEGRDAYFYNSIDDLIWVPFIYNSAEPYHMQNNPLKEAVLAWRTAEGWKKAVIKPILEYRTPMVKNKFPYSESDKWFDEQSLNPTQINGKERYFVGVVFVDEDGLLKLSDDIIKRLGFCQVVSSGGSQASVVDEELLDYIDGLSETEKNDFINKYIFIRDSVKKEVVLRLPIKQLRPQTSYQISFASDLVFYENGRGNEPITWTFTTMAVPQISGISTGSVGEDYDSAEPLIIKGNYFYSDSVTVKFNDISASRVEIAADANGEKYLKVYLPSGSSRLKAGIYDIKVINNGNENYQEILAGRLSVVPAADKEPPVEGELIQNTYYGEVREKVNKSEAVLTLKSSYWERSYIYLNLDEIMRESIAVHRIRFSERSWPVIWEFKVDSHLVKAVFRDMLVSSGDGEAEILIGKAEPELVRVISKKLPLNRLRSEFIEINTDNISFSDLNVTMFLNRQDAGEIKVLRYDERYRRLYEIPCRVDYLNGEAAFNTGQGGIFVLVEP
ncbi:hypothetical protein [Thermosyntropha sp.]|uniref:hypothetical protein n=1 Tax=Thermosyntropha sp. TaxID=2740820 RepID=UPI0025F3AF4D|nr:hypothetical protein [Thermosyntropha sp.]MBO8157935.1 hypothetical protein [Thermosyntropha sp.]